MDFKIQCMKSDGAGIRHNIEINHNLAIERELVEIRLQLQLVVVGNDIGWEKVALGYISCPVRREGISSFAHLAFLKHNCTEETKSVGY